MMCSSLARPDVRGRSSNTTNERRPDRQVREIFSVALRPTPEHARPTSAAPLRDTAWPGSATIDPMPPIALPYFLSLPEYRAPGPGIVVIHEGGGISPQLLRLLPALGRGRLRGHRPGPLLPERGHRGGRLRDVDGRPGARGDPRGHRGVGRHAASSRVRADRRHGLLHGREVHVVHRRSTVRGSPLRSASTAAASPTTWASRTARPSSSSVVRTPTSHRPRSSASPPITPTPSSIPKPATASCGTDRTATTRSRPTTPGHGPSPSSVNTCAKRVAPCSRPCEAIVR